MNINRTIEKLHNYLVQIKKLNEKVSVIKSIILENRNIPKSTKKNVINNDIFYMRKKIAMLENKICMELTKKINLREQMEELNPESNQELENLPPIDKLYPIGTIFYTSWGYEQTNLDYFQVVGHTGKKTVLLKRIQAEEVKGPGAGPMSGHFVPAKNKFFNNKVYKARVGLYNKKEPPTPDNIFLKLSKEKSGDYDPLAGKLLFKYDEKKHSGGLYASWYA